MPPDTGYGLRDQVKQELDYARQIFARHPQWPVIDVTRRSVEETAAAVINLLRARDAAKAAS